MLPQRARAHAVDRGRRCLTELVQTLLTPSRFFARFNLAVTTSATPGTREVAHPAAASLWWTSSRNLQVEPCTDPMTVKQRSATQLRRTNARRAPRDASTVGGVTSAPPRVSGRGRTVAQTPLSTPLPPPPPSSLPTHTAGEESRHPAKRLRLRLSWR